MQTLNASHQVVGHGSNCMVSVFHVKINLPGKYIFDVEFDWKKLFSIDMCDFSDFHSADFMPK